MNLSFIESTNRRKPNPSGSNSDSRKIFFIGLGLILGFTILLIPFGAYFPVSISIWALLIFFLPLLFIGISFISKYGYVVLFSVFLSLLDGGIAILYLGDYLGYLTETTAISNLDPEKVNASSNYKYVYLKDFQIKEDQGGSFQAPIAVRARGKSKLYGPVLQFRYAPIVSLRNPHTSLPLYALCYANPGESCIFSEKIKGGTVIREVIWDAEKTIVQGLPPREGAIFLAWRENGEEEFLKKGIGSFIGISLSIFLWAISCFLPRKSI